MGIYLLRGELTMGLLENKFEDISIGDAGIKKSQSQNTIQVLFAFIDSINPKEIEYIESNLVEISKGVGSSYSKEIIAKKLYDNFFISTDNKKRLKSEEIVSGLVAEFFFDLYIKAEWV